MDWRGSRPGSINRMRNETVAVADLRDRLDEIGWKPEDLVLIPKLGTRVTVAEWVDHLTGTSGMRAAELIRGLVGGNQALDEMLLLAAGHPTETTWEQFDAMLDTARAALISAED